MKKGHTLDLSSRGFHDWDLKNIAKDVNLACLNLNGNKIETFEFLRVQPNLTVLSAEECPVRFLNGLEKLPSLTELNIKGAPIEKEDRFRIRVIATIGNHLEKLNGVIVTDQERKQADLIRRKKPDLMFIGKKDVPQEILECNNNVASSDLAMYEVYVKEHQRLFPKFAHNKALIYDLSKFGPLPVIDEYSTEYEIAKAIRLIKERSSALRDTINDLRKELDENK